MAIIGISGKIGSGKDLIGTIIQYLVDISSIPEDRVNKEMTFDFWLSIHPEQRRKSCSGWEIKKFADKLKDIICLLIGCTREQLEDRTFKETPLNEDWWLYDVQEKPYGMFKIIQYSKDVDLSKYYDAELVKLTPRILLQLIGTEAGRKIIHPNIWVNALMADYKSEIYYMCDRCDDEHINDLIEIPSRFIEQGYLDNEWVCPNCKGEEGEGDITKVFSDLPNWIITDVRFPNEAKAIKERNGILIRVNRSPFERNFKSDTEELQLSDQIKQDTHESEISLDDYRHFDAYINNNGTIQDLIEKVRTILISKKIIY